MFSFFMIKLTFLNDGIGSPKKPETESGFWWFGYPVGKVQVDFSHGRKRLYFRSVKKMFQIRLFLFSLTHFRAHALKN